jgi:DNA-directed RNA polymerase specialized sigma24 family protein
VADLPEEERAAFWLKEVEGLTYAEVGARLGLHPDAARRRVARAFLRLRAALGPSPGEPDAGPDVGPDGGRDGGAP